MIGRLLAIAALAATIVLRALPAGAITFFVNTTEDTADDSADGLCLDASGNCSLRAAITEANRTPENDDVNFNLSGGGVSTFDLVTPLPSITQPLRIFGTGSYHEVVTTTHGVATGFEIAADGSQLNSLVIGGFTTAVHVGVASAVSLTSLRVGTNAAGTASAPNTFAGIWDEGSSTGISSNSICSSTVGLLLGGSNTYLSTNFIGSCDGSLANFLPNGTGIVIGGGSGSTTTNYVVGNTGAGIQLQGATSGWSLYSMQIYQNGGDGIRFDGTATNNTVGSANIHDNGGAGIVVGPSARNNRFSSLAVKDNGGLGIDLLPAGNATGVTTNDPGDADTGGNDLQNYAAGKTGFTMMRILSAGTVIQGGLDSLPNQTFTIEYYQSPSCDPSGFGEGQQLIGPQNTTGCTIVTTGPSGYVDIGCSLSPGSINDGWFVTALVTGPGGTSEFSQCTSLATSVTTTTSTTIPSTSSTSAPSTSTTTHSTTTSVAPTTTTSSTGVSTTTTSSTAVPTTTTSSTVASSTSTTLGGSTTSSTTQPGATSSSSTSTITPTTNTNPQTTSTSSSSTSTSLPPSCGDGTITAPELCDPAVPGSQGCCNPVTCLPFAAGTTCGLERDPCGAPVCDGAGSCITRPALLNVRCREPGAVGPCDPGAVCGAEPYCPNADTATGCEALDFSLAANAAKFKFRCKAKSAARQAVKCAADLVGQPGAALVARRRAANLEAVPTSDCTGPQFDTTLPKKLAKSGKDEIARLIVARINKDDRGYFSSGKTVCVRVRFTSANGYSQTRLYDVTVP